MPAWDDPTWDNAAQGSGGYPPQQGGYPSQQIDGQQPDWTDAGWGQHSQTPQQSNSKGLVAALVAMGAALVLTIAGGATYFFMQNDDDAERGTNLAVVSESAQASRSGAESDDRAGSSDRSGGDDAGSNGSESGRDGSGASTDSASRSQGGDRGRQDDSAGSAPAPAPAPPATASSSRYAEPACDGRGILIYESVQVSPGTSPSPLLEAALARYPGSVYTDPGRCPSLRASLDGQTIYPVYVDYGGDTASLCSAAAGSSANPRILSNRAEYLSPC